MAFISTFIFIFAGKIYTMILIIDIKNGCVSGYSTLKKACKENRILKYHYLKGLKLSGVLMEYKGIYLAKVWQRGSKNTVLLYNQQYNSILQRLIKVRYETLDNRALQRIGYYFYITAW